MQESNRLDARTASSVDAAPDRFTSNVWAFGFRPDASSLGRHVALGVFLAAELVDGPPTHLLINATFAVMHMYRRASCDPHCVSAVIEASTIFLVASAHRNDRIRIGRRYCHRYTPKMLSRLMLSFLLRVRATSRGCCEGVASISCGVVRFVTCQPVCSGLDEYSAREIAAVQDLAFHVRVPYPAHVLPLASRASLPR